MQQIFAGISLSGAAELAILFSVIGLFAIFIRRERGKEDAAKLHRITLGTRRRQEEEDRHAVENENRVLEILEERKMESMSVAQRAKYKEEKRRIANQEKEERLRDLHITELAIETERKRKLQESRLAPDNLA